MQETLGEMHHYLDQGLSWVLLLSHHSYPKTLQSLSLTHIASSALWLKGHKLLTLGSPNTAEQCLLVGVLLDRSNHQRCTHPGRQGSAEHVNCFRRTALLILQACNDFSFWHSILVEYYPLPSLIACCIIRFANINLFHQLKSASGRHIVLSLCTKTFPIIFSKSTVSPLPQRARATPFLVHINNFAACRSERSGQKDAA